MRFAGIIRKSPTNKGVKESIEIQKKAIFNAIVRDHETLHWKPQDPDVDWFIDSHVSGDDPNRPELNNLFENIHDYDYAYCHTVDRFSRSYLGLAWFHEIFLTDRGLQSHKGCQLVFVEGVGNLYESDLTVNENMYLLFFMLCGTAQIELMSIRKRTERGRSRLRADPKAWAKKYPGRKPGSKNKKKK